jgi:hypothetical protein
VRTECRLHGFVKKRGSTSVDGRGGVKRQDFGPARWRKPRIVTSPGELSAHRGPLSAFSFSKSLSFSAHRQWRARPGTTIKNKRPRKMRRQQSTRLAWTL